MSTPDLSARPKAVSVDQRGQPDGFAPQNFYYPQVLQGGFTRLVVSLDAASLPAVHRALINALKPPYKLLYQQLTDRRVGQLEKPVNRVAVEIPRDRLLAGLERYAGLVYADGRHQLWVRGAFDEQLVLDELGMVYLYPDDPSFRDALDAEGLVERTGDTMETRDYVRVNFDAAYDAQEAGLIQDFHLLEWKG